MSDTNSDRKEAVRQAWKNERQLCVKSSGTRDWTQFEQHQLIAINKVPGYDGQHMKSVKQFPEYARNSQNIQFLNRAEHIKGAHGGNTKNSTNGYYDPKTKTMHDFGNRPPQAPQNKLSKPLAHEQINFSQQMSQNYRKFENAKRADANKGIESFRRLTEKHQSAVSSNAVQPSSNKGIEATRQKAAEKQSGTNSGQSTNKGIASFQSRLAGQSSGASGGQSNSGQSSGSGKGQSR